MSQDPTKPMVPKLEVIPPAPPFSKVRDTIIDIVTAITVCSAWFCIGFVVSTLLHH